MGDPELRSDEKVLVRTPGVYVKSIPFEGILTNKRIILIDRAKNLLPPKEIPLVTIREVEPGENAIRDQIMTLSVMAKTGETRQMILTFSRQAGGNRIKERDAWIKIIREHASSSYDQVIRKVIPVSEPAPRKAEPAPSPRYEVVHTPVQQTPPTPAYDRLAGSGLDDISPLRRVVATGPATPAPAPAARQPEPPASSLFCPKCGNRVPAESVFCNRCGSPVARTAPAPSPAPAAPAIPSIHTTPVSRMPSTRPIDEEIRSIEPLIERSTERVPADALRITPIEPRMKHPLSWDDEEESVSPFEEPAAQSKPPGLSPVPPTAPVKSSEAAAPSPLPQYSDAGDTPPPPKPPSRSYMPGRQTILTAAGAVVVILIVAAAAFFVLPMLNSGGLPGTDGSGHGTPTPTSSSSTILKPGTVVVKETITASIPPKGIYVHINYLGGFKGSYGATDFITTVPGNSGDRVWEVENATNSTVTASFEKLDGSGHPILVEIYRDGTLLSKGSTTVGHGSVSLSVDMVTGTAAEPVTSGIGSSTSTVTATIATTQTTVDASVYEAGPAPASPAATATTAAT
ncbi:MULTISPECIES: zinc ribbon domain-containing protein [unclassified Methanoregula]|uniref:zinc ribbon domain-containing protein n=1 Tax=unclassified Methanoregula TaxID=2649730 RepID=UPI0009CFAB82|nr:MULTISPECIES: zinc ribbon domain-containing protein [unclassified Methanoregula]OPX62737.1 MAG: hypothetical protein A4E33_02124 [Methanoregula sp. PtaB.Bin085]OPY36963.1 MAG: hypothetical protein A4E34_00143 [Methanoregula sp. PtaU1.Bin006]